MKLYNYELIINNDNNNNNNVGPSKNISAIFSPISRKFSFSNYSIVKIGQNTEKSSGDLRRLSVTQTPAYEKTLKGVYIDDKRQILGSCPRVKKLWNMKVTVISIIVGAPRTVPKGLVRRLKELEREKESSSYRPQLCFGQLEYSGESWKPGETWC